MKHLMTIAFFVLILGASAFGQRFIYVDTEYILGKIPEYQDAQEQLDAIAAQWKQEIEKMYDEIDQLYQKYQAEQYLMDESTRRQKEDEIMQKEKAVKDYQKNKFGFEGELFQKRQELVKPIQDKVYDAIKDHAETRNYDFVLDKSSSGSYMLYANPKYDHSDEIVKTLGY